MSGEVDGIVSTAWPYCNVCEWKGLTFSDIPAARQALITHRGTPDHIEKVAGRNDVTTEGGD